MHFTLLTSRVVIGLYLVAAGASCTSRSSEEVTKTARANERDASTVRHRANVPGDGGPGQDAATNSGVIADSNSNALDARASTSEPAEAIVGRAAWGDARAPACLSGAEVSEVGCDSLLLECPLETDLIVLCFTIWNKARAQVMQSTLACFESHGCRPGALAALDDCYLESARDACIEDRPDCTELAGSCDELTKASCEAALAPFHDSIRERTLSCAREAFAQPSRPEASCRESFETCLTEVTSPVTL
jgi:hypothetical protein